MPILIMFRSLTYAQRGASVLERSGISASIAKAPMKMTDKGCSYCVRISESGLTMALTALERGDIVYGKVLRFSGEGEYQEILS